MNKNVVLLLVLVFLTATCVIAVQPIKADPKTIVVPDDYPTVTAAIRNANEGDTIFVKKGSYEEKTLKINRAVSLIGEDPESTRINLDPPLYTKFDRVVNFTFSWYGSAITVAANDFKLSGFTINTRTMNNIPGGEISIKGNRSQILNNNIATLLSVNGSYMNTEGNTLSEGASLFGSHGKISANNIVDDSGGIYVTGVYNSIVSNHLAGKDNWGIHVEGSFCLVYGNNVTDTSGMYGIYIGSNGTIVARNSVSNSETGIAIRGSNNLICGNVITNCGVQPSIFASDIEPSSGAGLEASGSNTFYANYVANNVVGADINRFPETNLTSTLYHNNFMGNTYQIRTVHKFYGFDSFDNGKEGNYWSDYTGEDVNGDGIGDRPYVIDENRSDRYPLMAPFDIDSVQLDLSEWMSQPSAHLISPKNMSYFSEIVNLEFTVSKQTSWMGYSLDGEANVTITENTTLPSLSYGSHNITVYATDMVGHNGASETIYFSIKVPFPTTWVVAAIAIAITGGSAFAIYYFKKPKRKGNNSQHNQTKP